MFTLTVFAFKLQGGYICISTSIFMSRRSVVQTTNFLGRQILSAQVTWICGWKGTNDHNRIIRGYVWARCSQWLANISIDDLCRGNHDTSSVRKFRCSQNQKHRKMCTWTWCLVSVLTELSSCLNGSVWILNWAFATSEMIRFPLVTK